MLAAGGHAAAATAASGEAVAVREQLASPRQLVGTNWRATLAAGLAALPELRAQRSLGGQLRGQILAGSLYLPANITVLGDTTIVARRVVFASRSVTIATNGHSFSLLPIERMQAADNATTALAPPSTGDAALANANGLTITVNGDGNAGAPGIQGTFGFDGADGVTGPNGPDGIAQDPEFPGPCDGFPGGKGTDGGSGESGTDGEAGEAGQNGDDISIDIPAGSTDVYELSSRGGTGGAGGQGGEGGQGGGGGDGGDGGAGYDYGIGFQSLGPDLYPCNGGSAGDGGAGGNGGNGGTGGSGGNGGNGGTITIGVPANFDQSLIHTDVSGGFSGRGGGGGFIGQAGSGGQPGQPGQAGSYGNQGLYGVTGNSGWPGSSTAGGDGSAGGSGTVIIRG